MLLTGKSDPILHVLAKNGVANTPAGSLILGQQPITSIDGVPSARASAVVFACRESAACDTELLSSCFITFNRALPRFVEPSSLVTGFSSPRRES
jgi:hypothetical protein